jgi:cobyrinic acid a,c-diamide synthase
MSNHSKSDKHLLPRVMIAGLRGSGGKTLVSVGLAAVLRKRGRAVVPFKKGADYIDAAWLAAAAGRPCRNLDLFMLTEETVGRSFAEAASAGELSVIEGNRGLFDGMDARGTYSTAELAKLLQAPVILVCDSTKTTRTLGAMVLGCKQFDPDVRLRGVILNRVAGRRHETVLREVVETSCGLPVLGSIPKLAEDPFPERHLGLVPPQEHAQVPAAVEAAGRIAERYLDIEAIEKIARDAVPFDRGHLRASPEPSVVEGRGPGVSGQASPPPPIRVGVFRDEAFQFYYPENLEALAREGAVLIESSPLKDKRLPEVDAIYIGGGFPEVYAAQLAANVEFRRAVVDAVEAGTPVYAECAGAVYLGESLIMGENSYPMTGALPVVYGFGPKPQWHGYAVMEVVGDNPYYDVGQSLRGHEFHYSRVLEVDEKKLSFAFRVGRGYGVDGARDGMCRANALATYCHVHALGVGAWAGALVRAGHSHRRKPRAG